MAETTFTPANKLTFSTVEEDNKRFIQFIKNHHAKVFTLDLNNVTQCDSAGLALLIEVKRLAKLNHKTVVINMLPASIAALAEFCGVRTLLMGETTWIN